MEEIIKYLIAAIAGSGLGTFLIQKTFEQRLSKKLFKFTKLYSDKLDIIRELYRLLVRAENGLQILLSQREPKDTVEKQKYYKKTTETMDEFVKTYEENELIFEKEIVEKITVIIEAFKKAKKAHIYANLMEDSRGSKAWENAVNEKQELSNQLEKEFPNLKTELKKIFQARYDILLN
ncbi:MAG: hypothetical protein HOO86_04055 [Bacteroidales bacterium]|nr:hypothetical protein [Bacteroidales bacterium]